MAAERAHPIRECHVDAPDSAVDGDDQALTIELKCHDKSYRLLSSRGFHRSGYDEEGGTFDFWRQALLGYVGKLNRNRRLVGKRPQRGSARSRSLSIARRVADPAKIVTVPSHEVGRQFG